MRIFVGNSECTKPFNARKSQHHAVIKEVWRGVHWYWTLVPDPLQLFWCVVLHWLDLLTPWCFVCDPLARQAKKNKQTNITFRNVIIYVKDCEQSPIFLCKIAQRVTHARDRWSYEVTPLFAVSLAGIRTGRFVREKADCKPSINVMFCSLLWSIFSYGKKKSMHELNSPFGRSLVSRFPKHEATRNMFAPLWIGL